MNTVPPRPSEEEDVDEIVHPLREAATRVGREVERFARSLDLYNPINAADGNERYNMALDLIDLYHSDALHTVKRLRRKHGHKGGQRNGGQRLRGSTRAFTYADEMDVEQGDNNIEDNTTIQDLERWEEEAHTWDLLQRLVDLRNPLLHREAVQTEATIHQYSSEKQVWSAFLKSNDLAMERKTVLRWLEDTAQDNGEEIDVLVHDLQQSAERGDIVAHGWLHTKAAIKNKKRLHTWPHVLDPSSPEVHQVHVNSSGTEPLVTQLDPDAVSRQGRKLEVQDEYFERSIWLGCFEMLRRGKSSEDIREWCRERTEIWRAVSLSGLLDNNSKDEDDDADLSSSFLWRRMCFALAKRGGHDQYESAVYGLLSGDLSSVEAVSRTWDDHVYAHYNALLKTQFDQHLQAQFPTRAPAGVAQKFNLYDAVQSHGDPKTVSKNLIESLKTHLDTKEDAAQPMKMIQGVLIADDFKGFAIQQGLAISNFANINEPSSLFPVMKKPESEGASTYISIEDQDSMRVLAHMVIILRALGLKIEEHEEEAVENVIVAYIRFLQLAGLEELIPTYAAQLSGERVYTTLGRVLVDVVDHEQRQYLVNLMGKLSIDVQRFVMLQIRYNLMDQPDDEPGYPAAQNFKLLKPSSQVSDMGKQIIPAFLELTKVNREEVVLIRCFEWYKHVDGLWSETFNTGSVLYKRFFSMYSFSLCSEHD